MGRPVTVQVGPLASASATKIGLSQKAAIAGTNYLVLNGAAGSFTANSVCASQTPGGAGALVLNGTLASSVPTGVAIAYLPSGSHIYITGGSDESGKTFVVLGYINGPNGGPFAVTETITGPNASTVSSINTYDQIISITASAGTTGAITVGHYGTATLDVARRVIFTSGGNDTGITITPTGTDWAGNTISEAVTGASGAAATTTLSYKTITSVKTSGAVATTMTIGTNGVADSPWVRLDTYGSMAEVAIQANGSGTCNWTIRQTLNDPNAYGDPTYGNPAAVAWVDHPDTALVASAVVTGVQGNYAYTPIFAKIVMNSGTGTMYATFAQTFQS